MFHISLLKKDITKKKQIKKFTVSKFETGDNKEYEMEAIQDSAIYTKETDGYLLELYYLVV